MEVSLFLTNSSDHKLKRVLQNIYLSLSCCEPDFSHKGYNQQKHQSICIFNKSPSFPQHPSQTLHFGGKKNKNPTHKGESERFNLSTQISAISEDGKFPPPPMNRSAFTEGLMKSDPLLTIKGASVQLRFLIMLMQFIYHIGRLISTFQYIS